MALGELCHPTDDDPLSAEGTQCRSRYTGPAGRRIRSHRYRFGRHRNLRLGGAAGYDLCGAEISECRKCGLEGRSGAKVLLGLEDAQRAMGLLRQRGFVLRDRSA